MSPMDWAFLPLQRYFVFYGRATRAEYWWFFLLQMLLSLITTMIDVLLGLGGPEAPITTNPLLAIALFVPAMSVSVRRLHDINRSGWTIMAYAGYPIAAVVVGLVLTAILGGFGFVLMIIGVALVTIGYFILMASDGSRGENLYGHNPYGLNYGQ
ncbi:MAG: DUF805 domain-containing protein [Sphingomonas bacterium]|nr:DUF805 domain-containing protein [Sphingomonas bacterium]